MPTVRGKAEVSRFIAQLPAELESKVLRGAVRAAAQVVAEEAKLRVGPRMVAVQNGAKVFLRDTIKISSSEKDGRIVAKVQTKGAGAYVAPWIEWGTAPHLITVDESQSGGRTARRINRLANEKDKSHSLVIGGKFVGATVLHPGARPHPFLRPALDTKVAEAIAAAQGYINARVTRSGIVGRAEPEEQSE